MSITAAKEALQGPIPTLRTPFAVEGEIDHQALAAMIEFDLAAGARALVLTYGDSHFDILSEQEVAHVHQRVAEVAGKRCYKVAADKGLGTRRAVAFARECLAWGFDIIMIKPPDWGGSTTIESLVEHYRAVAQVMPVMLVTNIFIPRGAAFGRQVVTRVLEEVPGVVSIKDDMGGPFARELCAGHADRAAIWAGGQKQNHLAIAPYGACGYLSTFLTFRPEIAHRRKSSPALTCPCSSTSWRSRAASTPSSTPSWRSPDWPGDGAAPRTPASAMRKWTNCGRSCRNWFPDLAACRDTAI
jgi:dihydrodipicolinate synthase/N-acetylneuraminate lyase